MRPRFVALLLPALALTACQTSVSADPGPTAAANSSTATAITSAGTATPGATGATASVAAAAGTADAGANLPTGASTSRAAASSTAATSAPSSAVAAPAPGTGPLLAVAGVVDGDTIKVWIDGTRTKIRLIGVDTPETVKPGFGVACYGKQASSKMQSLVQSKQVRLAADPSQADVDKYGRLLRYVFLADGTNVSQALIAGGFGREYTYAAPYEYRANFVAAQANAQAHQLGLWGSCTYAAAFQPPPGATTGQQSPAPPAAPPATRPAPVAAAPTTKGACLIKGNISSDGEKIYHIPGGRSYDRTKINKPGERWFCTTAEAQAAGFRAARD